MNKQTIRDCNVAGKRVLVRVDFNVPLDDTQHITDDTRIKAELPTIEYLLNNGAAVILMSHLGRPDGKVVEKLRLTPVAQRLSELLHRPVQMVTDSIRPEVEAQARALQPGQVLLLENLRFHKEEEKNDPDFAKQLASPGDLYVNDAFGTAHRAHASTEGVTRYLPGVAGFLMEKEINFLGSALEHPLAAGTYAIIDILIERTKAGATTIIGGGDSAAAVEKVHAADKMTHVSTGGGASLEFLEGRTLPGVAALQDRR